MQKILITYYSQSGSTKEIARELYDTIKGAKVDLLEVSSVCHLNYDRIIIGTPNKYGKPATPVMHFLKKYAEELQNKEMDIFFTCMDCYRDGGYDEYPFHIYTDTSLPHWIIPAEEMSSWQKSHAVSTYVSNLQDIVVDLNLASISFFKGRLNFKRLPFIERMVMRLISLMNKDVAEGDYLNIKDVKNWCELKKSSIATEASIV
ncbi:hypothetical protein EMN47_16415 [Prolixibacteraceae bacterium JC049]|nr:hypothetical protein [Prolixibacteraceae bacterium JC049]